MSAAPEVARAHREVHRPALAAATLTCMGVVFGDIGTSPLYTLSVAAKAASPSGQVTATAVLGVVSLIFWSLLSSSRSKTQSWNHPAATIGGRAAFWRCWRW